MKRQFFRYLSGIIPAIALFTSVNAQVANDDPGMKFSEFTHAENSIIAGIRNDGNSPESISRASKDFTKRFANAGNATWFEIKNGFIAKFENAGIKTRAGYDKKGRWFYTINTYGPDKLPKDIRKMVKSTYYDYDIYFVIEVNFDEKTAYLVKIQDEQTLKTIRVVDDEMDVYDEYLKN